MDDLTQPTPADVKALRAYLGVTQVEFAAIGHSKPRTVQEWEGGRREMPLAIWELYLIKTGQLELRLIHPKK